jgi:hypothetical protein
MHLMEESDHYDLFSENEKKEFIFQIFKHICLGGDICQVTNYSNIFLGLLKYSKQIFMHVSVQVGSHVSRL